MQAHPATPAPFLELGEMTFVVGRTPTMKLHADGTVELWDGHSFAGGISIRPDGTIVQEGTALGRVTPGAIERFDEQETFVLTATNERVEDRGKPPLFPTWGYSITPTGALTSIGYDFDGRPAHVEGARTPGQLRTMVVVWVAVWSVIFPDIGKFMQSMP
jgi:hypothetical protein